MRSLSIFGYVAIVIVTIVVIGGLGGLGVYYLCKYLKKKREEESVVPMPSPEKDENLK